MPNTAPSPLPLLSGWRPHRAEDGVGRLTVIGMRVQRVDLYLSAFPHISPEKISAFKAGA